MTSSNITVADFEKICRVCTRLAEKFTSITVFNIIDMIKACAAVQIFSNDCLPHQICEICLNQLRNAFNFKNLCETSDVELRQIYEKNKETENEEVKKEIKIESVNQDLSARSDNEDHITKVEDVKDDDEFTEKNVLDNFEEYDIKNSSENSDVNEKDEPIKPGKVKKKRKFSLGEKYNCNLCKQKFDGVWRLGVHMKKVHNAEGKQCNKCTLICYHDLHLEEHQKIHTENQLTCNICEKTFVNIRKLKKHKIAHSTERPYHCTNCDKSFKEKCVLNQHIKKIHINPDPHEVCQICGKSVGKASLERHLTIHDKRPTFSCSECPKTFYKEVSLTKHFRHVHRNEALHYMYLCNICGRGLLSKAELRRHLCTHSGEKPFECNSCDKKYNDRGALRRHVKSAHLDERPFACSVCSRAFHTKIILQNHMRKHTGERPFQCLICSKSFGFKTVLQTHMKVHS